MGGEEGEKVTKQCVARAGDRFGTMEGVAERRGEGGGEARMNSGKETGVTGEGIANTPRGGTTESESNDTGLGVSRCGAGAAPFPWHDRLQSSVPGPVPTGWPRTLRVANPHLPL